RIVRLATVRLGDAGEQAIIEFVGERDRVKPVKRSTTLDSEAETATEEAPADETASDEPAAETEAEETAAADEAPEASAEAAEEDKEKEA
ncbi:MAG TPA: 50S ribosomal protein L17, partial [Gimesia maris]|nr:50S ribosomal protein L17 [Gimesia maris]